MITVDGVSYPNLHVMKLTRSFSVLDGPNAGRVMTGAMVRDIIGTYYNYTIEIKPDFNTRAEYDSFYEVISAPQNSHSVVFPYGQTTLSFNAYVTSGEDNLFSSHNSNNDWGGISVNFIAMAPQRRPA